MFTRMSQNPQGLVSERSKKVTHRSMDKSKTPCQSTAADNKDPAGILTAQIVSSECRGCRRSPSREFSCIH